ncbi:sulfotransferase family protein [Trinickia terrae]|uniref:Sulfotransferase family protein n=1 Tax=Trinickia terrae TaxID=2571161 RepID=A0A4U1I9W2_9BURK|nr:sulfotransferase family protein [Trinickia terrae]TKC90308.1 sulfotransferase family protein [Trinickia terrae]
MNKIIAMWAHQRAMSTAFLRMMIERGDVTVIHEPLVTLIDEGRVSVPDGSGGLLEVDSEAALFGQMRELARTRTVFFKDTVEHRYEYLFAHPEEIADFEHTFIVREPHRTISSLYHMKPTITCKEVGYEHLFEIFELVRGLKPKLPAVIDAERLVADPRAVVARWCGEVDLPFVERALAWAPEDRPEWRRTQAWHTGVAQSSGFFAPSRDYEVTADNHPLLKQYFEHHQPFYEKLIRHAIR